LVPVWGPERGWGYGANKSTGRRVAHDRENKNILDRVFGGWNSNGLGRTLMRLEIRSREKLELFAVKLMKRIFNLDVVNDFGENLSRRSHMTHMWPPTQVTKIHHIIIDLKKYVPSFIQYSRPPTTKYAWQEIPFFKNNTDGDSADSIEANYTFFPDDKHVVIHCKRTCCYYVFHTCDEMVAFLSSQKKANPELLSWGHPWPVLPEAEVWYWHSYWISRAHLVWLW